MRLYEVRADDSSNDAHIEGRHSWGLPRRIGCPSCGVYSAVGASHPSIDLMAYPDAADLIEPQGVSWRRYTEMASNLRSFLGSDMQLGPGDTFGPLTGKLHGKAKDFVVGDIALLFVSRDAAEQLGRRGIVMPPMVPATLKTARSSLTELVELDLPRAGSVTDESYKFMSHRCRTCGRIDGPLERVVLAEGSLDGASDLFRPKNHSTIILASERLRDVVFERELTGLRFVEVEIADQDV